VALITFSSVSGAPGVTTAAVGATFHWPRPAIVVEADLSRASSILPGFLRGQSDHTRGLTPLSLAYQRGTLSLEAVWAQTLQIAKDKYTIPGFASVRAAQGTTTSFWGQLAESLTALESAGVDVVVDTGRISIDDPRIAMLQQADLAVLFATPTLPDVAALRDRGIELEAALKAVGHEGFTRLVLVDGGHESYSNKEIAHVLGIPVMTRLDTDPVAAAVFSVGAQGNKKTFQSKLNKALKSLPGELLEIIRQRNELLGIQPVSAMGEQA